MEEFGKWANFYVIVGSASAALISVQFVVIALIANMRAHATAESINAFGTPTVVHLGGAFMISAIMTAPWSTPEHAATALGLYGLMGLGYGTIIIRRARAQTTYSPVLEDWLWYAIMPCCAYAAITAYGFRLGSAPGTSLFVIGATAVALLLLGIRNAWDSVTHLVVRGGMGEPKE